MSKPAKKQIALTLDSLQTYGKTIFQRIVEKTESLAYDIIRLGIVYHKARHQFRAHATRLPDGTFAQVDDSFDLWSEENFPGVGRSSRYNYMRAAERALLAHLGATYKEGDAHTYDLDIVEELKESHTLHGVALGELYKPLPAPGSSAGNGGGFNLASVGAPPKDDPALVAQQTWFHTWATVLRSSIDHRVHLPHLPLRGDPDKKTVGLEDLKAQMLDVIREINDAIKLARKR